MPEIIIGFEGQTRDLNELTFDLFEAGMLRAGLEKAAPGDVTLVLKPMEMRKSFGHAIIHVGLVIGDKVALPLFLAWLYDKWKKTGEKPISIKIVNHNYQFDPALLTKAIQEEIDKETKVEK
jgi:hypothetical protein